MANSVTAAGKSQHISERTDLFFDRLPEGVHDIFNSFRLAEVGQSQNLSPDPGKIKHCIITAIVRH